MDQQQIPSSGSEIRCWRRSGCSFPRPTNRRDSPVYRHNVTRCQCTGRRADIGRSC